MAWRIPDRRDIAATLNQKELDEFQAHPDFLSDADPVADLIKRTAELVRGYIRDGRRRNRNVSMSPHAYEIPESLISPAMDYAAYDVLKRLPLGINEDRKNARQAALDLFKEVANGNYTPEPYTPDGEAGDESAGLALPAFGTPRRKILNEYPQLM